MKTIWLLIMLVIVVLTTDDLLTRHERNQFQKLSEDAGASLRRANDKLEEDKVRMEQSIVIITNMTEILQWQQRANREFEWLEGKIQKLDHRVAMDENALNVQTNRYESYSK